MSAFGSVSKLIPVKLIKFSSFLLVVPFLYGVIFKFRQGHAETSAGICNGLYYAAWHKLYKADKRPVNMFGNPPPYL